MSTPDAAPPDAAAADPSRNAVPHGLTAKRPLCEQEAEHIRLIVETWTLKHRPETEPEEALIRSAAIEHARYLRCVAADEAQMGPNARAALAEWQEKRRHAIRRRAQDLKMHPADVAADLHDSAFGIDWMIRNWKTLLTSLATGRGWSSSDLELALNLLGLPYQKKAAGGIEAGLLALAAAACPLTVDHRAAAGIADAEAAKHLRAFVADRIARLADLRPLVWEDVEGPQAAAIEAAAMLDTSKEGQLRQRYRREALRDSQRSLSLLMRLKVERSKLHAREARLDRQSPPPREQTAFEYAQEQARRQDAAAAAASESRNEPPTAPSEAPDDRRKSNPDRPLSPSSPPSRPAAAERTETPTEAHRGRPDAPSTAPDRPSPAAREAGSTPDRPR